MSKETLKVLVVDDNDLIRDLFVQILERTNVDAKAVNNPALGLELFKRGGFDLVMTDLEMHGDSKAGYKFAAEIRNLDKNIPIILVTGKTDAEVHTLGLEHGANRVLRKPVDFETFTHTVRTELAAAASRR